MISGSVMMECSNSFKQRTIIGTNDKFHVINPLGNTKFLNELLPLLFLAKGFLEDRGSTCIEYLEPMSLCFGT